MNIWFEQPSLEKLNASRSDTLVAQLGICFTDIGDDYVKATMPVDERTVQPFGLLHGGASVALAETVASVGANLCLDSSRQIAVGMEINANHVRSVRSGQVTAIARPAHLGRQSQVWLIEINDEAGKLVCSSRMTASVLARPA